MKFLAIVAATAAFMTPTDSLCLLKGLLSAKYNLLKGFKGSLLGGKKSCGGHHH